MFNTFKVIKRRAIVFSAPVYYFLMGAGCWLIMEVAKGL